MGSSLKLFGSSLTRMLLTLEIQKEFSNNIKTNRTVSGSNKQEEDVWFLVRHYKDRDNWGKCRCIWVRILLSVDL